MKEADLLKRATDALTNEIGLTVKLIEREVNYYNDQWDARLEIEIPDQNNGLGLFAEVRARLGRAALGPLQFKLDKAHGIGVLVTEYVNPVIARDLKKLGIQFFDAWGNAYINQTPLYIFVKGNRRDRLNKDYVTRPPRTFRPAALKLLFALLCNPGLEGLPLRQIATTANVALGAVPAAFKDLERGGYLVDKGRRGRRLRKKDMLLNRWVETYPEVLRPRITQGRYTALDRQWWMNARLPERFYWGGEVAAAKMTKYLKPEIITVYAPREINDFLLKNKLRRDENGEVEILEVFWGKDNGWRNREVVDLYKGPEDIVHPVLVYADLIGTKDARTHETAKIIYDDEVIGYIREG